MPDNPFHFLFQSFDRFSSSLQIHLSKFIGVSHRPSPASQNPTLSISSSDLIPSSSSDPTHIILKGKSTGPVTKDDLGRATWTFLHTLGAQYPDKPTRQQKKDVKELMSIMSRMYPCKECADHFKEVLRANPVQAGSHEEFSQWLCHVHNVVNRSLGKPVFPCERVEARWGKLECEQRACDLQGSIFDDD